ncbi:MAG: aldo/keto reductase [Bryobacteraceae bacterium]|jgi:aryl-alcohol dehydrogenase-like predicted oxidoreductase
MNRRRFVAASAAAPLASGAAALPRRPYRNGVELSIIGFGGIVVMGYDQNKANRLVASAWDRGVNYFDVAPSYGDGEAEIKLGPALEPYRKSAFLACKTTRRDAAGARQEFEQSLRRLRTDYFDLYQFHAVSSLEDVEKILAPGGAAEFFARMKKEGKVRFLGFSAHHAGAALQLMEKFPVDSILFPVNFVCWQEGNFGPQIMAKAKEKGIARLALKGLAHTTWPKDMPRERRKYAKCWYEPLDDPKTARLALSWTLSQDITSAIPPGEASLFELALGIAASYRPPGKSEAEEISALARGKEPLFRA